MLRPLDIRDMLIIDRLELAFQPGLNVLTGETGDLACDTYHHPLTDVDRMADLGLNAYRFSISWPRVFPSGSGKMNPAGLGFYDRLVDGLLERGIEPVPTLYHWDLPQRLEDEGGWPLRATAYAFADFAEAAARAGACARGASGTGCRGLRLRPRPR